ncbi:MAG: sucrase ferredoxin [Euzebyales bacterium]|nr:sucrase ferredoxin [Euzebyales bacterium]
MNDRFSCARDSGSCNEPLHGTASTIPRWILVEQPGPWGPDAVADSRLATDAGSRLRARARDVGARLLLIRRHGRSAPSERICLVASTTLAGCWVERLVVRDPRELLDVDWSPLAAHRSVGGAPVLDPVLLVCTNGRHDPCCAEFGRPLAAVLAPIYPEQLWESSHFGGDRFAGNLVCLPHGLYFGRVGPLEGPRVAGSYQRGTIELEHFRGRSCYPFVVQAAELYVRRRTGLRGVDDLALVHRQQVGPGTALVTFTAGDGRRFRALVEARAESTPRLLTCHGRPTVAPTYRLLDFTAVPGDLGQTPDLEGEGW